MKIFKISASVSTKWLIFSDTSRSEEAVALFCWLDFLEQRNCCTLYVVVVERGLERKRSAFLPHYVALIALIYYGGRGAKNKTAKFILLAMRFLRKQHIFDGDGPEIALPLISSFVERGRKYCILSGQLTQRTYPRRGWPRAASASPGTRTAASCPCPCTRTWSADRCPRCPASLSCTRTAILRTSWSRCPRRTIARSTPAGPCNSNRSQTHSQLQNISSQTNILIWGWNFS